MISSKGELVGWLNKSRKIMHNIMSSFHFQRKSWFILGFHAVFILSITLLTFTEITSSLYFSYFCFSSLFLLTTLFSINVILDYKTGVFAYLLNLMFLLGFWFKFSIQKLTGEIYREPIGYFVINSEKEANVLWVVICGMLGFLLAQLVFQSFFSKQQENELENLKENENSSIWSLLLLISATIMAAINIKYNILLLGVKPSLQIPLKGNAIFFLMLTRATPFLFFYYCFRSYSHRMVYVAGVLGVICSVGVLSRMIVLSLFFVFFVYLLQVSKHQPLKNYFKKVITIGLAFIISSYFSVLISSGLREYNATERVYQTQSTSVHKKDSYLPSRAVSSLNEEKLGKYFNLGAKLQHYKELALGRWIGIEGVMAVEAYPQKSFSMLWDALNEKSYSGNSYYTKIAQPNLIKSGTDIGISTSVPGPLAFFYYSGEIWFVFLACFLATLFCLFIEKSVAKLFAVAPLVMIYVSTFMVFDFFQFGISPQAFLRYWGFSFACILIFYWLVIYFFRKENPFP